MNKFWFVSLTVLLMSHVNIKFIDIVFICLYCLFIDRIDNNPNDLFMW